jgi:hypothetical protein
MEKFIIQLQTEESSEVSNIKVYVSASQVSI